MDDERVEEIHEEVERILEEGKRARPPESSKDHDWTTGFPVGSQLCMEPDGRLETHRSRLARIRAGNHGDTEIDLVGIAESTSMNPASIVVLEGGP